MSMTININGSNMAPWRLNINGMTAYINNA